MLIGITVREDFRNYVILIVLKTLGGRGGGGDEVEGFKTVYVPYMICSPFPQICYFWIQKSPHFSNFWFSQSIFLHLDSGGKID